MDMAAPFIVMLKALSETYFDAEIVTIIRHVAEASLFILSDDR